METEKSIADQMADLAAEEAAKAEGIEAASREAANALHARWVACMAKAEELEDVGACECLELLQSGRIADVDAAMAMFEALENDLGLGQ